MSDEREILTWDLYGQAARSLAVEIAESGFQPDMVLAIARGGLAVACSLGYALSVKNLYTMNVEFYTGVDVRMPVPLILPPVPDFEAVKDAKVLIADDVADTGHTLKTVKEFCADHVGEVRCAVLYEKPRSMVKCEYVWKHTDHWINFPWSDLPPVAGPKGGGPAVLDA